MGTCSPRLPGTAAAEASEATLETGLKLPSLVVPVGFGEVRVNVVPTVAGKGAAPVA